MRIRYLKPDFFKDEDLAEHPYWIRLLFAGLWNIADKEGRLEDRNKRIKADLFPYDNGIDIEKGLEILAKQKNNSNRPFIQRYTVEGEYYIQIVNWHKHQRPHHTEQESKIPPAPPLKIKIMEKGMEKQHEGSAELRNGETTVKQPLHLSDDDFIRVLKTKEVYTGIDIDRELGKMDAWLLMRPDRKKTRRFIVNWLNKIERPVIIEKTKSNLELPKPINEEQHKKVAKLIHETAERMRGK